MGSGESKPELAVNQHGATVADALDGFISHAADGLAHDVRLDIATAYFNVGGYSLLAAVAGRSSIQLVPRVSRDACQCHGFARFKRSCGPGDVRAAGGFWDQRQRWNAQRLGDDRRA